MSTTTWLNLALLAMLLLACAFDVARRRIPNRLLASGLLTALVLHLAAGNPAALLSTYLAGCAVGLLMFLPLYLMQGMAAGDVKLMATVGAFVGPSLAFQSSLVTYCAGGVLALAMVLAQGRGRAAFANVGLLLQPLLMRLNHVKPDSPLSPVASVGGMPYALAITAGTVTVLWFRHT